MQLACEGFSFFQIANEDKLHSLPVSIAESFVINGTNKERRKKKRRSDVIEIIRKERKSNYTDWFLIHPLTITNQTSFLKKKEKKRKEKTKERKKKKRSRVEKGFSNSLRKKRRAISPASGIFSLTRFEGSHWHAKFAMATRPSCLLLSLSLFLSLYSLPPPCESTPQLDAQTRGVRFKGSLTSDRGFFSSRSNKEFDFTRLTRKRGGDKMGRRGGGDKGDEIEERWRKKESGRAKKENYISCSANISFPPPLRILVLYPTNATHSAASSTKFNLVALLLPSRNPLHSPSPTTFRRQPTRLTIARLPDPRDRMAKRMRESGRRRGWIALCASSPSRIYEILLAREGGIGVLARWKSRNCESDEIFPRFRFDDGWIGRNEELIFHDEPNTSNAIRG